jgi:tripartite-type tricarboxylate transporter receptor subunit TctC
MKETPNMNQNNPKSVPTIAPRRALLTSVAALGAAASLAPATTWAQVAPFPSKPITLYCGFPAGGPTDLVLRALAEAASRHLGQQVLVEAKPGAGGILGAAATKNAKTDGYIVTQMPIGVFRLPYMQKTPLFDPIKDFTWIINLTGYTFGLVVPADSPIKNIKDFVAWAKANPGKLTYGSTGVGTSPHLAIEEFASRAGITLNHVPYKGSADMMVQLLGGHVMAGSDSTGWAPHVESGKMRLLATYGSKRTRRWPQVATLTELGYETVSDSPFGLAGPANMDPVAVKAIHDAFRKALEDPKALAVLDRYDQPVVYLGPEDYRRYAVQTFEAERQTIERLGLRGTI